MWAFDELNPVSTYRFRVKTVEYAVAPPTNPTPSTLPAKTRESKWSDLLSIRTPAPVHVKWDQHNAGEIKATLSNGNQSIQFNDSAGKWRTCIGAKGFSSGVHMWEFGLDRIQNGNSFIGVAREQINKEAFCGYDINGTHKRAEA